MCRKKLVKYDIRVIEFFVFVYFVCLSLSSFMEVSRCFNIFIYILFTLIYVTDVHFSALLPDRGMEELVLCVFAFITNR